jgi:hypothetical protein
MSRVTSLPNRDELSFLIVFALPNASSKGLQLIIYSSNELPYLARYERRILDVTDDVLLTDANRFKAYFVLSVFPLPLSPEITIA